ncbi:MAG: transketolase [Candidatus Babeliales bacterium]
MNNALVDFLNHKAYAMRVSSLQMTTHAGSGHPTSALSAADIMAVLFFYTMQYDPKNHDNPNNDRFILSKGHASPILYAAYKELGILSEQDLMTYRTFGSVLEGHPTPRFSYSQAATGSLGQGLSIAAGIALSAFMDKRHFYTYALLGDSEVAEGSVWEAVEVAAYYKLHNLVAILDENRLGQSTETIDGYDSNKYAQKFEAFGWNPLIVNVHSVIELMNAFDQAQKSKDKPSIIIAKTIKGYGVPEAENKMGFHGKAFLHEELPGILAEMKKKFAYAASYADSYAWQPKLPKEETKKPFKKISLSLPTYKKGDEIPTRKAYGQALAALGFASQEVVALDAEVKNSTYAEIFEKDHPKRFVQCFIAEQNMIGMAVGMTTQDKIPFASTFGAFMTRAFDQIRMAAIGHAPLRLCGSHAGVSIGQDGPSQMALEDIAMMRTIPDSVIFYPADAVSTYKLVAVMANNNETISYLRTTRGATPVLYDNNEEFKIGGCKVLRQSDHDTALVIGAGITLHNALEAYEWLKKEKITIAVIDLYSVKPLDHETILSMAKKAGNCIITVEDHYLEGGLGQAVTCALRNENIEITNLAVRKLPRSGAPEELMAWEEIDAQAIVHAVKKIY